MSEQMLIVFTQSGVNALLRKTNAKEKMKRNG